ncbi:major facilitator superfamily domain-containing protein [Mycena albidolilacea]|uniref:Major facilitator superfamily domain-containing protein n=1 Tax=Mycena albidolilacea TaxID=1033008 RepID=A0AAD6ZT65_9AGAR|nr:major facilitator superfamily domain-containing protein [Mycena albidolilacea]
MKIIPQNHDFRRILHHSGQRLQDRRGQGSNGIYDQDPELLVATFSLRFKPGIACLPCPTTLQNTMAHSDLSNVQCRPGLPAEAMLPVDALQFLNNPVVREKSNLGTCEDAVEAGAEGEWNYPDGGLRAWLVVAGCFIMAATCMGWGLVWGVFQDFYHTNKFSGTPISALSLVGGLFAFSMNCATYVFGGLGERYGYKRMIALSCLLAYLCLLASAFATKLYQVYLFQGCLLGFSMGISMPLYMALPSQWFFRRRGLATGIAVGGSGLGGGIESLIVRTLLSSLGYRDTIIIYSSGCAVLWTAAWFMMAERRPPGYKDIQKHWLPRNIGPVFYSIAFSVFFGIFGYLSPYYFSATYVKSQVPSLDPKSILVVMPLVVMNMSGGAGRIIAGRLADQFGPINMFFTSFFLGGLSQIFIWTFAHSYAAVIVFSVIYGLVGCWFLGLLPVVCAQLFGLNDLATITGLMILVNSPGQLAGASIGGAVFSGSGGDWRAVSLYSGCVMLVGAACVLYARFSYDKRIWAKA